MAKPPTPPAERFWSKVQTGASTADCWPWTAARNAQGYGHFGLWKGVTVTAHRLAYELTFGPLVSGLDVDHLCRRRDCVNPWHLEAVSHAENMRRALADRTLCRNGHDYPAALRGGCRVCIRERDRRRRPRKGASS